MDRPERPSTRLSCLLQFLSFLLVAAFLYYLMSYNTMKNSGISDLRQEVNELSKMMHDATGPGPPETSTDSGAAPQSDQKSIGPALTKWDSDVMRKVDGLIEDVKQLKQECNQMNSVQQPNAIPNQNGINYRNFAPNADLMPNPNVVQNQNGIKNENGMPTTNGVQGSNSEQYPSTIYSPRFNQDPNSNDDPNSYQYTNGMNSQYSHQDSNSNDDPNSYQYTNGMNSKYSHQDSNSNDDPNSYQYTNGMNSQYSHQDPKSNDDPNSYPYTNGMNSQYSQQDSNSYQHPNGINNQFSSQYPNSRQDPRYSNQSPGSIHSSSSLQKEQTYQNRLNFASDKLGARVVSVSALPIRRSSLFKRILALDFSSNRPVNMLRSSLRPGACFGYRKNHSTVTIHLAKAIIVETITLSHTSKDIIPSTNSTAPKDFEVFGMKKGSSKRELLGQFTYSNDALRRTEIYNVDSHSVFQLMVFDFFSNHGADVTCIYRLEVYGHVPDPESEGNAQVDDAGKGVSCGKEFCGEGEICEQGGCRHRNNTGDEDPFGSEADISGPEDPGEPADAIVENDASGNGEAVSGQGDPDRGQICGLDGAAGCSSGCIPCHTEL